MKKLLPNIVLSSWFVVNSKNKKSTNYQLPTNNSFGFTLIELLVAISIIAILSIAGLIIFQGAQKNARDGRRRQDIDAIAQALETNKVASASVTTYIALTNNQFASNAIPVDTTTEKYCIAIRTSGTTIPSKTFTSWTGAPCGTVAGETYKQVGTTQDATYENGAGATTWTVCAKLENGTNVFHCKSSSQ